MERSKLGFYFRAIRDDQEGAEGIGIDSRLYKVIARCITAGVFAAGGVLYGFWALAVFPEQVLDLNWSTLPMMATVVGGIGRLWGPVLGAVILIPISQIMSTDPRHRASGRPRHRPDRVRPHHHPDRGLAAHRPPVAAVEPVVPAGRLIMSTLLELRAVTKRFGGLIANKDVSFAIGTGEIVGLIGPNGAGKTTLFNCITGYMHPEEGQILLGGVDITHAHPARVCAHGIARTWQLVRTFGRMTVLENVICGALKRTNRVREARVRALRLLEFSGLAAKAGVSAANLTLADKKRLEIARALATQPRMLLLDEAMSGLTPTETAEAVQLVRRIHGELGVALCVVEHVMEVVMPLSQRVIVLEYGQKLVEGPPQDIVRNEQVIKAYLGEHRRDRH